jgi:hypothetical protein
MPHFSKFLQSSGTRCVPHHDAWCGGTGELEVGVGLVDDVAVAVGAALAVVEYLVVGRVGGAGDWLLVVQTQVVEL